MIEKQLPYKIKVYNLLKDEIISGKYEPGDELNERRLSEQMGISRTPIHDALRSLESEGLVTISHNRGATVMRFTESEIREIGAVRLMQDILSAQLAARYGSAADFARLDAMAEQCEQAARRGAVYERIQTDLDFHLEITRISRNSRLLRQQYALYQQIHLIQISQYTDVKDSLTQILHQATDARRELQDLAVLDVLQAAQDRDAVTDGLDLAVLLGYRHQLPVFHSLFQHGKDLRRIRTPVFAAQGCAQLAESSVDRPVVSLGADLQGEAPLFLRVLLPDQDGILAVFSL